MKNWLGGEAMIEFAGIKPKTYIYLTKDDFEKKRQKAPRSVS